MTSTARLKKQRLPVLRSTFLASLVLTQCTVEERLNDAPGSPRAIAAGESHKSLESLQRSFELAPGSFASFALGVHQPRLTGRLPVSASLLQLELADLSQSRGWVTFDLSQLDVDPLAPSSLKTPSWAPLKALQWLEVDPTGSGPHNLAHFRIRQVGSNASIVTSVGARERGLDGSRAERPLDFKITGDLSLHGIRYPLTLPVRVTFDEPEAGEPVTAPLKILSVQSRGAARVDLEDYRIVPRTPRGDVDSERLAQWKNGPYKVAKVTFLWKLLPLRSSAPPHRE